MTNTVSKLDEPIRSTPASRRDWAHKFALELAERGEGVTVRDLQNAIRERFGISMGTERASKIVKEVSQLARSGEPAQPSRPITTEFKAPVMAPVPASLIVETMRLLGVRKIELREDGSLNLMSD